MIGSVRSEIITASGFTVYEELAGTFSTFGNLYGKRKVEYKRTTYA